MAVVRLSGQLQSLTGGEREHEVSGSTVREALIDLEQRHPAIAGWILDERRAIRRHIKVFVNTVLGGADTPLEPGDRIHVLPSITGG
jgi:molybdopterin converting factor small subunit